MILRVSPYNSMYYNSAALCVGPGFLLTPQRNEV